MEFGRNEFKLPVQPYPYIEHGKRIVEGSLPPILQKPFPIIFKSADVGLTEVTGSEPFTDSSDLTLNNTAVVNGYLRRSYIHTIEHDYGGTNRKLRPTKSVWKQGFTTMSWARIISRFGFVAGQGDGFCCGDIHNNAGTSRICRLYSTFCIVDDRTWYYWNQTIDSTPNCLVSPSTAYRVCICGKANSNEYRYSDNGKTKKKRNSYDCPTSGSNKNTRRMYRTRVYVADFGTDPRDAIKLTSDVAPADITKATLTVTTLSGLGSSGGTNNYYVSRDGGTTWIAVSSGVEHEFSGSEVTKNQFKFKVEVGQNDRGSSERIDLINWSYKYNN
jgi:hypothetical protein